MTDELKSRLLADEEAQYRIRMRAYEIYLQRGGGPGGEASDWFQAEWEILSEYLNQTAPAAAEAAMQAHSPKVTSARKPRARAGEKMGEAKKSAKRAVVRKAASSDEKPKKSKTSKKKKEE
jgi:hypothetical protein